MENKLKSRFNKDKINEWGEKDEEVIITAAPISVKGWVRLGREPQRKAEADKSSKVELESGLIQEVKRSWTNWTQQTIILKTIRSTYTKVTQTIWSP